MQSIYIIWLRELKKYWRNKSRIVGSLGMPFFFLFIMGTGLNDTINHPMLQGNYTQYILPGIMGMVILFNSIFSGVSVIWDKQFGFMKEMLVAPISRLKIVIGKTLGGATTSIFQGLILLGIATLIGIQVTSLTGILLAIPIMFLISMSFVAIGLAIASKLNDMHGFQLIVNFLIMPLFFLSGALFPLDTAPLWLQTAARFNPLTYGVDALRNSLLGISEIPLSLSITVLITFMIICMGIGTVFFRRMQI